MKIKTSFKLVLDALSGYWGYNSYDEEISRFIKDIGKAKYGKTEKFSDSIGFFCLQDEISDSVAGRYWECRSKRL